MGYYGQGWNKYSKILACRETETFETDQMLIRRMKEITKGLQFQTDQQKVYRPSVKISQQARQDFLGFYFANFYGIT